MTNRCHKYKAIKKKFKSKIRKYWSEWSFINEHVNILLHGKWMSPSWTIYIQLKNIYC